MFVANNAPASVWNDEISVQGKERVEFDLHRPRDQATGAGMQDFGETIVDFVFLSERDNSHSWSLLQSYRRNRLKIGNIDRA